MWQTERGIDIHPQCKLYIDCKDNNDDGNNDIHDDNDQTRSDEAASTSSSVHNDHDQEQSEEAASTSSSDDDDAMVPI